MILPPHYTSTTSLLVLKSPARLVITITRNGPTMCRGYTEFKPEESVKDNGARKWHRQWDGMIVILLFGYRTVV
jgi:hypothetical protein